MRLIHRDYFCLSTRYFDAVAFVPKKKVLFHGFGVLSNYNGKDCTYIVKWIIDGQESEQHQIECKDSEKNPEKRWHEINIKEFGIKPIKVDEGVKIDCAVKIKSDDMRRCFYGDRGRPHELALIEGQTHDFDTARSSLN